MIERSGNVGDIFTISAEGAYSVWNILEMIFRIVLAGALGAVFDYDRMVKHKGVGPGTHMLIAATAALAMVVSKYAFADMANAAGSRGADNARVAAQVVSGVSFLCAAVIFKADGSIHGLTTAAGMWATAGIGLCLGSGLYIIGIVFTAVAIAGKRFSSRWKRTSRYRTQEIKACITDSRELYESVLKMAQKNGNTIERTQIERENGKLHLRIQVVGKNSLPSNEELNEMLLSNPDVFELHVAGD